MNLDTDRVDAPWDHHQIASLIDYQRCDAFHPYTCNCGSTLDPTINGWKCLRCHRNHGACAMRFTLDGSWRKHAEMLEQSLKL